MKKERFYKLANNRFLFRLYLIARLPAAWFMRVQLLQCTPERTVVQLPYGWRSQNPFRSTYFAAQCAAGELSTGMLCLAALQEKPPVSMLVTHIEAEFFKKADKPLTFRCDQGIEVATLIEHMLEDGQARSLEMKSIGTLPDGVKASEVRVQWSFKPKQS
jgi:hypothetical protein